MRNRDAILVGLDIGTTKVCAVAAEVNAAGGMHLVGFGEAKSEGIRKGVVVNIERTVTAIREAVRECELMAGVPIKEVYAGIAGSHIQGTNEHGMVTVHNHKMVSDLDIQRAITSAQAIKIPSDRNILHILPRDFVVDEQDGVQNPLGMSGIRLEVDVHIVTCSVTSEQNIVKCCNLADLDVMEVVLEPLASAKAVLTSDEKELGAVVIDIGGGTTDIVVYSNGNIIHTAVLAVGGNHITNDIAIGLSTPLGEGEQLKKTHGVAMAEMVGENSFIDVASMHSKKARKMDKRLIAEIAEERLQELFEMVIAELDQFNLRKIAASGVVLCGGVSLMPGCDDLASKALNMPVRIGRPTGTTGLEEKVLSPVYTTAIGLLTYAQNDDSLRYLSTPLQQSSLLDKMSRRMRDWVGDLF